MQGFTILPETAPSWVQLRRNVVLWYRLVGLGIEKLDTLVLAR